MIEERSVTGAAPLETETLTPDATGFTRAADILGQGGLVAFPTETVYGLGADARSDLAVARIFEAKGRPRFNPLIVHVPDVEAAKRYVVWDDTADRIASAFWPGPLTLVLPLRPDAGLSPLVTADLPTLAIRIPAHPVARALLKAFDGPVAAPSANPSGRISPTEAAHVLAGLSNRIEAVVDGGPCDVGVESTILGLADTPRLLRPGGLPLEALEAALGASLALYQDGDALTAPGQMTSHYAPGAPVRLNAIKVKTTERLLGFGKVDGATLNLSPSGDLTEAAANLFHHLHRLDQEGDTPIAVSPVPEHGLGRAINDRLRRAAAPRGA
ncbi:L-threonylcarbamoyladenylate synthase [Shimia sp. SK013]|uniref:L-threonylcarbamoyladenylate synthase n=1 Tax=Shimia sp. SK013 TaxID=1389006 RepID=UPI0006B40DCC|nr:L-threonylcarbamoyladenylate synthase [Shimia sp. SK013]